MGVWSLSQLQVVKAQTSLCIYNDMPEPSLLAHEQSKIKFSVQNSYNLFDYVLNTLQ